MNGLLNMPLRVGARLLGARTRSMMRRIGQAGVNQQRILGHLVDGYARSRRGRMLGIDRAMGYEQFAACAPLCTYEDLAPHVDRLREGARDELWPGPCRYLAISSGTTMGPSKYLPVNGPMLEHFRQAGLQSLLLYTARTRRAGIFDGRQLFLGGATGLQRITAPDVPPVFAGDLSGITARQLPCWADALLYEPGARIAGIDDWPRKIDSIVARTLRRDIRLVAGIPSWLLVLFESLQRHARNAGVSWSDLRSVWPGLTCLVHGGVPVEPYVDQLRAFTGPDVDFHEVFPASEGFIAAQDGASGEGLRLLDNTHLFFEFVPVSDIGLDGRPRANARAWPLVACNPGVDYALVLSTPAGLCRYLVGDVVRFVSIDPPRLLYVGRTRLQLSAFGEHVIERELTESLAQAAGACGLCVDQFHVAPRFAAAASEGARGSHEWWIECSGSCVSSDQLAAMLDRELQCRNDDYAAKRRGRGLNAPTVRLVPAGTFEMWMRSRGRWGGQNKMPRCRSDRRVADELDTITRSTGPC